MEVIFSRTCFKCIDCNGNQQIKNSFAVSYFRNQNKFKWNNSTKYSTIIKIFCFCINFLAQLQTRSIASSRFRYSDTHFKLFVDGIIKFSKKTSQDLTQVSEKNVYQNVKNVEQNTELKNCEQMANSTRVLKSFRQKRYVIFE